MVHGAVWFVAGAAAGAGAIFLYSQYVKGQNPLPIGSTEINLTIEKEPLRNSIKGVQISLSGANGEIVPLTPMTQKEDGNWVIKMDLSRLQQGDYLFKIIATKQDNTEQGKDFVVVLPNAIGTTVPHNAIYKTGAMELRWI